MATTQVSITYGGKTLDCELSFTPPYQLSKDQSHYSAQDCELTLEKVSLVCKLQLNFDGKKLVDVTHLEDITDFLSYHEDPNEYFQRDNIEELAITAINERGYV